MASASGTLARAAPTGLSADHACPAVRVSVSGVKVRFWLGRKAVISDCPAAARTRPPLSAVPGGVISFHRVLPAGRMDSCQKLLCRAADPPITAPAPVPAAVTTEVSQDRVRGAARVDT